MGGDIKKYFSTGIEENDQYNSIESSKHIYLYMKAERNNGQFNKMGLQQSVSIKGKK